MNCTSCGKPLNKPAGAVIRAAKAGAPLYCDRWCAGLARRRAVPMTVAELKAQKKAYDAEYRKRDPAAMKAYKAAYHLRTYDPKKAAKVRKRNMPRHVAYCRRPEYKVKKHAYDRQHSARKQFGDFAESFLLLQEIEQEIASRATRYEIYQTNGTLNKALMRRRAL